jgi:hypothetical protein
MLPSMKLHPLEVNLCEKKSHKHEAIHATKMPKVLVIGYIDVENPCYHCVNSSYCNPYGVVHMLSPLLLPGVADYIQSILDVRNVAFAAVC